MTVRFNRLVLLLASGLTACKTASPSRTPTETPRDRARATMCEAARTDPSLLGLTKGEWDGGSCGGVISATSSGCGVEEGEERSSGFIVSNSDSWKSTSCGGLLTSCGQTYACICTPPPRDWRRPGIASECDAPLPTTAYVVPLDCAPPAAVDADVPNCRGQLTGAVEAPVTACVSSAFWSSRNDFVQFGLTATTDRGASVAAIELDFPTYEQIPGVVPYFQIVRASGTAGVGPSALLEKAEGKPAAGYVGFNPTWTTNHRHGVDFASDTLHGCLSARFDLLDGGADAGSAYLWLEY